MAKDRGIAKSALEGEANFFTNMGTIFNEIKSVSEVDKINLALMNSKVIWFDIPVNLV